MISKPVIVKDAAQKPVPCLVADIGGTNSRFAIALLGAVDVVRLTHDETYLVDDYPSLEAAISAYINILPEELRPRHAILAVASAITSDHISFTNSEWSFSRNSLQAQMGFTSLRVINDFAALAWVVPTLEKEDVRAVGVPIDTPAASPIKTILGPGTGLGVSAVNVEDGHTTVISSEAGHMCFAPVSKLQQEMNAQLLKTYERVSYERLLSGVGLFNLYTSLCLVHGEKSILGTPQEVSHAAKEGDHAALRAVEMFCEVLGAFAGDCAMAYGSWSGVYLAGGLIPHVMTPTTEPLFRKRFEQKGRYMELMQRTPTWIITKSLVGQFGAACYGVHAGIGKQQD